MESHASKKSWVQRWWVLAIAAVVFLCCASYPLAQIRASMVATASRVYPLMKLSVRRVGTEWVVSPLVESAEDGDTLWIYKPQSFYYGFWAPVKRDHRTWVRHSRAVSRGKEADTLAMLAKVEEYLSNLPTAEEHSAALAVVRTVRESSKSHASGPDFMRSEQSVSFAGYLQLAALVASAAVLCAAVFLKARLDCRRGHP